MDPLNPYPYAIGPFTYLGNLLSKTFNYANNKQLLLNLVNGRQKLGAQKKAPPLNHLPRQVIIYSSPSLFNQVLQKKSENEKPLLKYQKLMSIKKYSDPLREKITEKLITLSRPRTKLERNRLERRLMDTDINKRSSLHDLGIRRDAGKPKNGVKARSGLISKTFSELLEKRYKIDNISLGTDNVTALKMIRSLCNRTVKNLFITKNLSAVIGNADRLETRFPQLEKLSLEQVSSAFVNSFMHLTLTELYLTEILDTEQVLAELQLRKVSRLDERLPQLKKLSLERVSSVFVNSFKHLTLKELHLERISGTEYVPLQLERLKENFPQLEKLILTNVHLEEEVVIEHPTLKVIEICHSHAVRKIKIEAPITDLILPDNISLRKIKMVLPKSADAQGKPQTFKCKYINVERSHNLECITNIEKFSHLHIVKAGFTKLRKQIAFSDRFWALKRLLSVTLRFPQGPEKQDEIKNFIHSLFPRSLSQRLFNKPNPIAITAEAPGMNTNYIVKFKDRTQSMD